MKVIVAISVAALLTGCAQTELKWHAQRSADPFTNARTCMVTTWFEDSGPLTSITYRPTQQLYPVAQRQGDTVLVGFMTAPSRMGNMQFSSPAGDVQLKIDAGEPLIIAAVETPIEAQGGGSMDIIQQRSGEQMDAVLKNTPYADPQAFKDANKNMMASMSSMMSPMTLATGEKAANILRQMKAGKAIMYRRVGAGMGLVSTDPITFTLNGFNAAAAECGI